MEPAVSKPSTSQVGLIVVFVLICLGITTGTLLYSLPEQGILLLAVPLVWVAARRSTRVSAGLLALVLVCNLIILEMGSQRWFEGLLTLAAFVSSYVLAVVIIKNIQRQHEHFVFETHQRDEEASLRYRMVANYAHHFEFLTKPDGSFAYVSPSCKRVLGLTTTELLQNPQVFFGLILPEDRSRVLYELSRARKKNEENRPFEFGLTRPDGQSRRIEMVCHQVFSDQGEYLGKRGTAEDITDIKLKEQIMQAQITRLSTALESANEGMWDFNLVNGKANFSSHYARILGLPEDQAVQIQDFHSRVHPEDMKVLIEAIKAHLQGKTAVYEAEYRLRLNGDYRWILDRGRAVERDLTGKATRLVGVHVDITHLKQVEEALRQSENKFRQLAENMREVFWLRDRTTRKFIYISPTFSEIWGHSAEALYDNPNLFIETIYPEDLSRVFLSQKELFENAHDMQEEFRIVHASGQTRWVWFRAYAIYNEAGEYYRMAGFIEDITERKQADLSLQESEKRYRDLIEQQGGGVGIFDPNDKIIYINPAGEEIFGVPHGTLAGRNLKEFLSDDQVNVLMAQTALRRQGVESSYELMLTRPDEEKRSLLFTATPRFDANNQFLGNIIIFRDISQRKMKEQRLLYVSQHDTLTGLYNRGVFEEELTRLDQGVHWPISVIMIDADGLKIVNDQMGHARGDELLIRISGVLKAAVRDSDIVSRIGGDEFAILLPNTDEDSLKRVMDRIFEQVAEENRKVDNPFTISISAGGMVCYEKGGLRGAYKEADNRMYQAKNQKKNQFYLDLPIIGRKKL